ncbi:MAG: acyl-ACP--UDP-N-acetylglucosamine O-acyltransferase [Porticoccaceae bacterium]|nr:acyl-ACP--UDP-N-acetylglucosamine O-acyltransferase [Porticoccaceae bacterium]
MANIHPTAVVDPSVELGKGVEIGPLTVIGPNVVIGDDTVVASHVVIQGPTVIGAQNRIFQFSTIGEDTPDMKYNGEPTRLVIGDRNIFREGVTVHRGTMQDNGETLIGNDNLFMAYVHIGHDCVVGNHTILVNNASISGHIHVGDWVFLSGYTLIHQFVRIGAYAFLGAGAYLNQDLPAYVMAAGHPAVPRTINKVGLERRGFSKDQIKAINRAYKTVYRQGLKQDEALARLDALAEHNDVVQPFIDSIRGSTRGIIR